jgi:hypothetical protein
VGLSLALIYELNEDKGGEESFDEAEGIRCNFTGVKNFGVGQGESLGELSLL